MEKGEAMTPEEQISLLQRKCERYHQEVEAKDEEIARISAKSQRWCERATNTLDRAEKVQAERDKLYERVKELEAKRAW